MKRARKKLPKGIRKLPNGQYLVDLYDSQKKRHRKERATLEDAVAYRDSILAQKATGRFHAQATNKTLHDAMALRYKKLIDQGRDAGTLKRFHESRKRLEKFGHWSLNDFVNDRMEAVKALFEEMKKDGAAQQSMAHIKSALSTSFGAAITAGWMPPPNPVVGYDVEVPFVAKQSRKPITLEHQTAIVRAAWDRDGREQDLAFYMRQLAVVIGLQLPLRTQDVCGVCWDCVKLKHRIMFIRRVVKDISDDPSKIVWSLEEDTKTGEEGFGELPMSPMIHAMLCDWRDRLHALGYPTEGEVPVLRTSRVAMVTPPAMADHVSVLMEKAGLLKPSGANEYTWYNFRHTVPSMLSGIGMSPDDIQDLMRHANYQTTKKIYKHRRPEYVDLYGEVEDVGLDRTRDGLIDALAIVLTRRWREAGIDVPCSPPRARVVSQHRLPNYHQEDEPRAIGGNILELVPTAVTVDAPVPTPLAQLIMPYQRITELRRAEAKRLSAPPHNWTRKRIADHLGICTSTVATYLGDPDEPRWMRKVTRAERDGIMKKVAAMHDDGVDSKAIAQALDIPQARVRAYERERGKPMKHPRKSYRYGQHEAAIRQMLAEGKKPFAIARELGLKKSGLYYFMERIGLRPIKDAKLKARVSAASKPASDSDESRETGENSQLQLDLGTDLGNRAIEDAAD